jgi:gamma-glutamyltranspeptidase/glutathione hydrolase
MQGLRSQTLGMVIGISLLISGASATAQPATGAGGMVVASQIDAAQAGLAMLEAGGNAVDAAVATAFALSVSQPFSAGVGGGMFALIRLSDGKVVAIDGRETAPASADRDMYVRPGVDPKASLSGALAVATPGFVRSIALVLERWGTLPLAKVLEPAIVLADEGFAIGPYHARMLERTRQYGVPKFFPETGWIQFPRAGTPARAGWRLVQKEKAQTLRLLALEGPDLFYTGAIAAKIAAEVQSQGGLLTAEDLAGYEPKLREPVTGKYRDLELFSFPPPSSGGAVLVEILNVLEGFDLSEMGPAEPAAAHRVAESMKLAFADRAIWFGDPDFVEVPVAKLTSKAYAEGLRARIEPPFWKKTPDRWSGDQAIDVDGPGLEQNDSGTTHLSTTDAAGNAVALTMTINTPFGSGITVPGTGILLNNEMDDFSKAPGKPNVYGLVDERGANAIAPKKRPLSSMTPTILLKGGRVFMVTGSPGGPRIITTTLHTILNVVDHHMDVQEAVAAPRYHHQWLPNKVYAEPELPESIVLGLRERGHEVEVADRTWSSAQSIVIDPETGLHLGGSDPRGDGAALGFNPAKPDAAAGAEVTPAPE